MSLEQSSPSKKRTRGNRTQPLQKKNATTMDAIKHTYDAESDTYVVPRELMIATMEKLEEAVEEMRADKIHPLTGEIMKASDILKLEKEIHLLEDRAVADYDIHMKQYKQFKDENEKLKEENKELKLKEENKKLQIIEQMEKMKENNEMIEYHTQQRDIAQKKADELKEKIMKAEVKWEVNELKWEVKALKLDAENSKAFWECFMDCKGNPDNPTKLEMIQWCDDNNKSHDILEYIMEYFGDEDEDEDDEEINKLLDKYAAMVE